MLSLTPSIGEFNYTCICVVKLNCKKAISTCHDKHVLVCHSRVSHDY